MRSLLIASFAALTAAPAAADGPLAKLLDQAIARSQAAVAKTTDIWEDHTTWERAWRVQTEHYEVRRLGSHADAFTLGANLEMMLANFQSDLAAELPKGDTPMKVFVFPKIDGYKQFGDDFGEHHSSIYGGFYAKENPDKPIASYENEDWLNIHVTNAALHQFVDRTFPAATPPTWVTEGLAAYFCTYYWGNYPWALDKFNKLRESDRLIPLARLMGDSIEQYGTRTEDRMIQLGMLFAYLLKFREDTKTTQNEAPFRDYLLAYLRNEDPKLHEAHNKTRNLRHLQREFAAFEFPR